MMARNQAQLREQLGRNPDTFPLLNANYQESIAIEEGPTQLTRLSQGCSWIVGSSTNGIVGANTGTDNGQQQVVGACGREIEFLRVVNPLNRFYEHFRDNTYEDTSETTADWDTTNFWLKMSSSSNTEAVSEPIQSNLEDIPSATMFLEGTNLDSESVKYYLSNNDGATWEEVTLGVEHTFSTTGQVLRFRITNTGSGWATPFGSWGSEAEEVIITEVKITFL